MTQYQLALTRLEKMLPSGIAFFGFLLIFSGIVGILTTTSELSEQSQDIRKAASGPLTSTAMEETPSNCIYQANTCEQDICEPEYVLICDDSDVTTTQTTTTVVPSTDGSLSWNTSGIQLEASSLSITTPDGQTLTAQGSNITLGSKQDLTSNPEQSTLMATWSEGGSEHQLTLPFYGNPQNKHWYLDEIILVNTANPDVPAVYRLVASPATTNIAKVSSDYGNTFSTTSQLVFENLQQPGTTIVLSAPSFQAFLENFDYCQSTGERPADITGDQSIDILDSEALTNNLLQTGQDLAADLNCDYRVDVLDQTILQQQLTR